MKKLFVFAVAFIAFTGFSFSGKNEGVVYNSPASVKANAIHDFTYFRIHQQTKKNVVLSWGIDSPAGVSSFTIERTYDGDFYEPPVYQVACNDAARFTWKDEGVYPGEISYRITCNMSDGTTHYSNVETIRIVQR